MTGLWSLPERLFVAGQERDIRADFRDVLRVIELLERPSLYPEGRLYLALRMFYPKLDEIPQQNWRQAADAMMEFLAGGREDEGPSGPKLLDWQQDADLILSDVNRVAGKEIRAEVFVHWWTFLGWFGAIGEGRLSAVVAVRKKLREGKALESWEKEFYRENKARIDLKPRLSVEEQAEKQRLEKLLNGQ